MQQTKQISTPKIRLFDEGHVVKGFYIGHTHVQICDDYCVKTQEEMASFSSR